MITLDDLIVKEGNGKVVLLNAKNGHWVRMRKDKYDMFCCSEKNRKVFEELVEKKFDLLGEEKGQTRKSFYFAVTGRCNLQCEFCTMNSGPHVSTKNDLNIDEIRNVLIPELLKVNPRKIVITGGEPLMRRDILEILDVFCHSFEKQRIVLQTNGLLLNADWVKKLADKIGVLEISIENIFDDLKLQKKMESIFEAANEADVLLSLSFVVDQNSEKHLEEAIEICHKYHAILTTRIITLVGRAKENNAGDKLLEEHNALKIQLKMVRYLLEKEYFDEGLTANYSGDIQPQRSCGAFGNVIAIHPDGTTFMCANFKDKQFSMGNVRENSMEELCEDLLKKTEDPKLEKKFCVDKILMCENCWAKYFCSGPCAAEVAENGGIPELVDSKCLSRKALLNYCMFYYEQKKSKKENLQFLAQYLEEILRGVRTV